MRDTVAGRQVITHGGGIHGFITANAWVPDAELSVTVLTNSGVARAEPLARQLMLAALGAPLDQPPKVLPLAAADRDRYAGVYSLALPDGARDFTIAVRGDGLTAQLTGQPANPILHYGNHTFGAEFDPSLRITFVRDGALVTSLVLRQAGTEFQGTRKQ